MNVSRPVSLLSLRDDLESLQQKYFHMGDSTNLSFPRLAAIAAIVTFQVYCTLCNKILNVPINVTTGKNNLIQHLESSAHEANFVENVDCDTVASELTRLQNNFKELKAVLGDVVGNFNMMLGQAAPAPAPVFSAPSVKTEPNVLHPNSSIICNVCNCTASSANDDEVIIEDVSTHISGGRHSSNIENFQNKKSLWCCYCECNIPISEDYNASVRNLVKHIDGSRHRPVVYHSSTEEESEYSY